MINEGAYLGYVPKPNQNPGSYTPVQATSRPGRYRLRQYNKTRTNRRVTPRPTTAPVSSLDALQETTLRADQEVRAKERAAQIAQYGQEIGNYDVLATQGQADLNRALGLLDTEKTTRLGNLNRDYTLGSAQQNQELTSRGLGFSGIRESANTRASDALLRSTGELNQGFQGQRDALNSAYAKQIADHNFQKNKLKSQITGLGGTYNG